ncbi:glycosyltransferase family 2 protein [Oricola sp.]|uniref:glycosyltransferase family 2 protein n=1 Tax=Oricola sp. TaxID=1979950 RepID=UPI003BACA7FD
MIVFPMAGESKRFKDKGYTKPKYQLPLFGETVFHWAVLGFARYFDNGKFLFVCRQDHVTTDFVSAQCRALGISDFRTVELKHTTKGQAETVSFGLDALHDEPTDGLTIFNVDTFRSRFEYPATTGMPSAAGFLETFIGEGDNWSFVEPGCEDTVKRTAEKDPISTHCCTGLYHFSTIADFRLALEMEQMKPDSELKNGEIYVAPLYNNLISRGRDIRFTTIPRDDVIFCGVPAEYEFLQDLGGTSPWDRQRG